jgi:hypothetical protein
MQFDPCQIQCTVYFATTCNISLHLVYPTGCSPTHSHPPFCSLPPLIVACIGIQAMDLERTAALPACKCLSGWRPRGEFFFYYYYCYYYYYYYPDAFSCPLSRNAKIRIYKAITLPVVLYGFETWSLTLREEHRLRVFEKRCRGGYLDRRGMR